MGRLFRVIVATALTVGTCSLLVSCATPAEESTQPQTPSSTIDMALMARSIAGITPGETTDDQVLAMHGPSAAVELEDGGSERYYTDAAGAHTLKVVAGADGIIHAVQLSTGATTALKEDGSSPAAGLLTKPAAIDRGIKLGDDVNGIPEALGRATRDEGGPGVVILVYESALAQTQPDDPTIYRATYTCLSGTLTQVAIYVGD